MGSFFAWVYYTAAAFLSLVMTDLVMHWQSLVIALGFAWMLLSRDTAAWLEALRCDQAWEQKRPGPKGEKRWLRLTQPQFLLGGFRAERSELLQVFEP